MPDYRLKQHGPDGGVVVHAESMDQARIYLAMAILSEYGERPHVGRFVIEEEVQRGKGPEEGTRLSSGA